ncbi:TonB-dependent receptor [Aliiglaciecola sp. CAU 1673]|uniref:TonB-dependent receptor n=1 Tax=Aliiglaciecola sp. CAU 1673 TaxID=3032595 RepID=UPI0023DB50BB|nr:TonB-dependent receptor [Aliiglaciecola sp. CAU 1673]MDF2177046.1 TonB-dependent receptor [Aliiglaciecola sp. CAU 1673]
MLPRRLSAIAFSVSLGFGFAEANDDGIEHIYITSERLPAAELATPFSVEQIEKESIRTQGYRSLPEILESSAGVMVQKTSYGQGSPYIRGFTGFRTLMLIDGIRLNNAIFREGPNQYWNTVDAFSVDELELVRGPASALYGADAIGGTVQVLTTQLDPNLSEVENTFEYYFRGATAEHSNIFRISGQREGQGQALQFGLTSKDFGDLKRGDNIAQPNTGYGEHNLDGKWVSDISEQWRLTTAAFYTRQDDVPRTHRTIYSTSFAGTTIGNELRRDLTHERLLGYMRLDGNSPWEGIDQAHFTLSWHNQKERRDRERSGNRKDSQGIETGTLGVQAQLSSLWGNTRLVYGAESYIDNVDSFSSSNSIQGPVADDAEYQWHGIYVQARTPLSESLDLLAGLRFNHMRADAGKVSDPNTGEAFSFDDSWSKTVGNLMLHYKVDAESVLYAGVSQGFRAPNLSDLTRFDSARSNEFEIPATNLDAEHYNNLSLGYKWYNDSGYLDISSFYTDIRDQILRFPTGVQNADGEYEISKANLGDGYLSGWELRAGYHLNDTWSLSTMLAYIKGKVDTFATSEQVLTSEYPSRLMPTTAHVALDYQSEDKAWWSRLELIGVEKADRLSSRDMSDSQRIPPEGTPGYGILNLRGGHAFNESFRLHLTLENLFDKDYRIHGSGQNEAGRNLIVGIDGVF